jgi:uncharacterized protein
LNARSIFIGPAGLRAGWRLLLYVVLVFALGFVANKIADALLRGRQPDPRNPFEGIWYFSLVGVALIIASAILAKIEDRRLADYGFPLRRIFCGQFWLGWVIGVVSLTVLLTALHLAGAFSFGPILLHGATIWKLGVAWAVLMTIGCAVEEYVYRGYLQFTLTPAIGFWPAAVATSALMAVAHMLNPYWNVLGLFNVFLFGLVACLLLRRTGDLWMPLGIHASWDWGEGYFFGVPSSGQTAEGALRQGAFHGPAWLTGWPFGPEAGWPNVALLLIWFFLFAYWFREVKYPKNASNAT